MTNDELYNLIKNRRSYRRWTYKKVPTNILNRIAECGVYAPSGANTQKVKIQIVTDPETIENICKNTSDWFYKSYPTSILTVYFDLNVKDTLKLNYLTPHKYWSRLIWQDSASSMTNMMLMAEAYELKTCWVSVRPDTNNKYEQNIREILDIPDNYIITSFLFIGYSDDKIDYETFIHQGKKIKRDLDNIIKEENK